MKRPPEHVLLVLVAGIGDFVLATPAIRSFRRRWPGASLMLLTTPQTAELAQACPYLDEVATFALRAFRPGERGAGWRGWSAFRDLTADLRRRRFDLAVNLFQVASLGGAIRMGLLFARIGAGQTAGRWSGGRGMIFGVRSPDRRHELDAMLALADTLGCPAEDDGTELWIPEASRRSAETRLREANLGDSMPYAVLNTGSNRPEARLPLEKAVGIGLAVRAAIGIPILLTGDRSEASQAERVAASLGASARSLAGKTGLLELAAILQGARVVISTDTGPMHMAAAVGAPLVVLYGPGDPARSGPRGRKGQVVMLQGRDRPHDPRRWHEDVTAEQVAEAARRLLAARPGLAGDVP